jgi:hypothetical protein
MNVNESARRVGPGGHGGIISPPVAIASVAPAIVPAAGSS